MIKRLSQHAEWLSLVEISGPFLTVATLEAAFPQGLDSIKTPKRQKLRAAYYEWRDAVDDSDELLPELHREWVQLVLKELLEFDSESLSEEPATVQSIEHSTSFSADLGVRLQSDSMSKMLIKIFPPDTDFNSIQQHDGWNISLFEKMTLLCRSQNVRLGLLTNGEQWMVINAPSGNSSGSTSWYARLWFQEPITLKAFQSLINVRRFFGQPSETLEALLDDSLKHHEEVTDTLGEQVRRAVEVLVQCLDRADQDRNRELLDDVTPAELYEAGLTVMMRLVFILCAEERRLLLLGDPVYDQCYAVSTIRAQLSEDADRHGAEVLDRRHDAWARLLAVFRAVYGGVQHESLLMPALGGSLFDPDRFPFLEGRKKGTHWKDVCASPLPIDNRTVLLLMNSLQILEQTGGAQLLSYRALDVEQIGHVYEGLLEHTVVRVPSVTLGLTGSQKAKNPNIALAEIESAKFDGNDTLVKLVKGKTERSESAIASALKADVPESLYSLILGTCGGNQGLAEQIKPYANLLRTDAWGDPIVYMADSFMVTLGADRRETGTHYTPKSLTETIVSTTLEPIVYVGPAEGLPQEDWKLKSSAEILDLKICDPAMGSGAFLVQACRYLSDKLVDAWTNEERKGLCITVDGHALPDIGMNDPMPSELDERRTMARRLVAERCLYGVDINPLAVELAKLSLWLTTMSKGRPFGFLDHNLRSGDSLLGLHRLDQLTELSLDPSKKVQTTLFGQTIGKAVEEAIEIRERLRATQIKDIRDVEAMAELYVEAQAKLELPSLIADALVGYLFLNENSKSNSIQISIIADLADRAFRNDENAFLQLKKLARISPSSTIKITPFHWTLVFPEVFINGGFNAIIGNPPFLGGLKITEMLGEAYNTFLSKYTESKSKKADLCAYFFLRIPQILSTNGNFGLIATNTISQGVTRKSSLDIILNNGVELFFCVKSFVWPGKAAVVTAIVLGCYGKWQGFRTCDSLRCEYINSLLEASSPNIENPTRLLSNKNLCYQGSTMWGDEFFVEEDIAKLFVLDSISNNVVVKQAMGGRELNNSPLMIPSRWAINFGEMDMHQAMSFQGPFNYVECNLKEKRSNLDPQKYSRMVNEWWKYFHSRSELYATIEQKQLRRVLARSRVSDLHMLGFIDKDLIFTDALVVFCFESWEFFALLQSSFHDLWSRTYASTMKSDVRYVVTDCFETFPFPLNTKGLENIGEEYYKLREHIMVVSNAGLTQTYNRFHSNVELSAEISDLRRLHIKLDQQVASAYGWDDIDLEHGFHLTKQGLRFTISEAARLVILRRLIELNKERSENEPKLINPKISTVNKTPVFDSENTQQCFL